MFKQMKYFVSIVETHSFTEAAQNNYISQSAISQQIKALENELGVKLLIRKNRSFELTPAGEYFYRHVKSLLKDVDHLLQETVRRGSDAELNLNIAYLKNYTALELHEVIMKFSNTYPEVNISLSTGTHEELYNMLVSHEADIVLTEQRRAYSEKYINYELKISDCFVELASSNPLSQKEKLSVDDLKSLSCILVTSKEQRETERDFYQHILRISDKFIYADNLEQARMLVLSNRGFLPIDAIGKLSPPMTGITRRPLYLKDQPINRNYFACWEKERTNYYIEEFAEMFRQLLNH